MSAASRLAEINDRGVEATYTEISHRQMRQLLSDHRRMQNALRATLAWAESHKTSNGLGYDCVQARDVAAIIEKELS